jgi:hypothetical protein
MNFDGCKTMFFLGFLYCSLIEDVKKRAITLGRFSQTSLQTKHEEQILNLPCIFLATCLTQI